MNDNVLYHSLSEAAQERNTFLSRARSGKPGLWSLLLFRYGLLSEQGLTCSVSPGKQLWTPHSPTSFLTFSQL